MELPEIDLVLHQDGSKAVTIDEAVEYSDLAALFAACPALTEPEHAQAAAEAVNHMSYGSGFSVILDPGAFAASYMAAYDAEDNGEWNQFEPRLSDFGRPNLSDVAAPKTAGDTLTFFARDRSLGLAYRVTLKFSDTEAEYLPVPMGG